jgi:hypothetical protein
MQRLLHVLEATIGQLASLHEAALAVVAVLAADEQHAVDPARQRIRDPDDVQ